MKKWFALFLAVMMMLSTAFASTSTWQVQEYVDEFNDPTGDKYIIAGPFEGTFSNSATTNSSLKAYVLSDGKKVWFQLLEYGQHQVSNLFSSTATYQVKVKATLANGGPTAVFAFVGGIESGSSELVVYDQLYTEDYTGKLGASSINSVTIKNIVDVCYYSTILKFSITKVDSSFNHYSFAIDDASGFAQAVQLVTVYNVTIGTKVNEVDLGKGVISKIYHQDGKRFATVTFDKGNTVNYQIPWAFEVGILTLPDIQVTEQKDSANMVSEKGVPIGTTLTHKTFGKGTVIDVYYSEEDGYLFTIVRFKDGKEYEFVLEKAIQAGNVVLD